MARKSNMNQGDQVPAKKRNLTVRLDDARMEKLTQFVSKQIMLLGNNVSFSEALGLLVDALPAITDAQSRLHKTKPRDSGSE